MNDTKKVIAISVVTSLVIALLVGSFYRATTPRGSTERETIVEKIFGGNAGPVSTNDYECIGDVCYYYRVGNCQDATTTLFSILPPENATSTVERIVMTGTMGTTSAYIRIGTSTNNSINTFLTTQLSPTFVQVVISTSTGFYIVDRTAAGGGPTSTPATFTHATSSNFIVGPGERLTADATSTVASHNNTAMQGFTNTNDTFSCTYAVTFSRPALIVR
mgnify:CR=1 FL=1